MLAADFQMPRYNIAHEIFMLLAFNGTILVATVKKHEFLIEYNSHSKPDQLQRGRVTAF